VKPFLARPGPYLVAHRGGARLWPENTLPAFDGAARLGADAIELDVRLTADGEVVVFHDESTERVAGEPGSIEARSLAEVGRLDAGRTFTADGGRTFPWRGRGLTVPTLAQVLARYPGVLLNVEAKAADPALAEALVGVVRRAGRVAEVCLGSSHDEQGERLRALLPGACHFLPAVAATCHVLAAHAGGEASGCPEGWDVADLPWRTADGTTVVDAVTLDHFHRLGIPVHVWTVDEEADMRALLDLGVDGIMSDLPDRLARVMGRHRPGG
jgi:glycerophosphoryl diester phosphodiesterase